MKPIFSNREILGHARTSLQARRVIVKAIGPIQKDFRLSVAERDVSILDGRPGWVYSVQYVGGPAVRGVK